MNPEPEDDALSWAGDSDPTLSPPRAAETAGAGQAQPTDATELPEGWSVPGSPAAVASAPEAPAAGQVAASVALVGMGILAGVYLLYAVGWFIGVSRMSNPLTDPVGQFMFSLGAWTAVVSPLVWFGAAFQLTRDRPRTRIVVLLLGVVLLAPLPFIIGAGGAS
ncbi:DNA polymerase III subunit gamma/tau [Glaciibacter sp. 2TAF33]|uniref:DNA polymerase III subunit gamma/tau n=1 Tax=Glaciibacter sp. 2TAF33 TaxID=3233015 RepID=UPI003F8E7D9A